MSKSKARLTIDITETEYGFRAECHVLKPNGSTMAGDKAMALAENLPVLVAYVKNLTNEQDKKEQQHATH
jgi:hypothetical protein